MNPRWSYSRISCFKTCPVQYYNKYLKEFSVIGKENELANKGTSFHQVAEWMESGKTLQQMVAYASERCIKLSIDLEKYPIIKTMPRFYAWWEDFVKKYEDQGYTLEKEKWMNFKLPNCDENIVGAIDTCLINKKDKKIRIYDFKSGKQPKTDGYVSQLMMYTYAIGKLFDMTYSEMISNIECWLFFPLAGLSDDELTDAKICEKNMLKNMKQVIFTENDLKSTIEGNVNIIKESIEKDWNLTGDEGLPGYYCSFCDYLGVRGDKDHPEFVECKCMLSKGFIPNRKWKLVNKEELKALKKELK